MSYYDTSKKLTTHIWVYDTFDKIQNQKCSCLIGWTPLKGSLPDKDYKRLVKLWNLNAETYYSNKKAI